MKNTRFFDTEGFMNYLNRNFAGDLREIHNGCRDEFYLDERQSSSFQLSEEDFLGSCSVTSGLFVGGFWEEMRMRIKSPKHFDAKVSIPSGKYRVRVEGKDREMPLVRTYNRGLLFWSEKALPRGLPLSEILMGDLEDYGISSFS